MFNDLKYPIALILTHRRGVGIMVCKDKDSLTSNIFNEYSIFNEIKKNAFKTEELIEFLAQC